MSYADTETVERMTQSNPRKICQSVFWMLASAGSKDSLPQLNGGGMKVPAVNAHRQKGE